MKDYLGKDIKKLGFGFMRLPMVDGEVDVAHTQKMVDHFMSNGFTYFDTAYVYIGGKSEVHLRETLVKKYPRESFQIASKMPTWGLKDESQFDEYFNETMERLGIDYIDFYLVHALNRNSYKQSSELGVWEFIAKKKAEGKIKHIGFSFHDNAEVLDQILTEHPETEFVQLQINYVDWESDNVQSRKCYEVALKHNKPIIIMEPVKGGTLANVSAKSEEVMKKFNPSATPSSWAVRYCASLDNIITVLSGMSNMEQIEDNVSYMKDFKKFTKEEYACIDAVVDIINKIPTIPCTDCKYCVDGCPMNINIPRLFGVFNQHKKYGADQNVASNKGQFNEVVKDKGLPSECVSCGACEGHCPQKIEIIQELANIANVYEK